VTESQEVRTNPGRVRQRAVALTAEALFFAGLLVALGASVLTLGLVAATAGGSLIGVTVWVDGQRRTRIVQLRTVFARAIASNAWASRAQVTRRRTQLELLIGHIARRTAPAVAARRERARGVPLALVQLGVGAVRTPVQDWRGWPHVSSIRADAWPMRACADGLAEDERRRALTLNADGAQLRRSGQARAAIHPHGQALEIFRGLTDRRGQAGTLNSLALSFEAAGEMTAAVEHFEESLAILRDLGDERYEGRVIANLGLTLLKHGEDDRGRGLLVEALDKLEPASPSAQRVEQQLRRVS